MKKKFMLMAILALSSTAFAANTNNIAVEKLNDTVITTGETFGTKTRNIAKNIHVVTREDIKEKGAMNVQEALKGVPGVLVRKYDGGIPSIDLRGSGAAVSFSGTTVLLDGVPINGLVKIDINTIPIEEIEKIEIIQGGGAVIYGDGSTGGVVNIITKSKTDKKNSGSIGLEIGSWKTRNASFNYDTKLTDKLSAGVSYSNYSSLGYRDRNKEYEGQKDRTENIMLRGRYELQDGDISLKYLHTDKEDIYTGYLEKAQFDKDTKTAGKWGGKIENKTDIWNLSAQKKISDNFELHLYGGYAKDKSINQDQVTKEYFISPELKYNYAKDSYIILGGDFRNGKREFKKDVTVNGIVGKAPDDKRKSKAGYIMNKTTYGNFQFTQGYRFEKVDYKYSTKKYNPMTWALEEITPKDASYSNNNSFDLGLNYLYSDSGNIYFNFTKANRTPTIGEAGAWGGDVKTQKDDIFEIGLRDYYKNTSINASIFYITSKNEVYYDKTNPNNSKNRNFDGKVLRTGAQLSLVHDLDKLTLRENISYINPKVKSGEYKGNQFAGVSKWTANLGATYRVTNNLTANVDGYYQSAAYAEDDFDNYFGKHNDYITVDANISYKMENGLEVYGGVKNLFNKKYATTLTSTRAAASAWSPLGPRIVYYPADGRSFYTGLKYTF